jgi:hypothetical protein
MGDDNDVPSFIDPLSGARMTLQNAQIGMMFGLGAVFTVSLGVFTFGYVTGNEELSILGEVAVEKSGHAFVDVASEAVPPELVEGVLAGARTMDSAFPTGLPPAGPRVSIPWAGFRGILLGAKLQDNPFPAWVEPSLMTRGLTLGQPSLSDAALGLAPPGFADTGRTPIGLFGSISAPNASVRGVSLQNGVLDIDTGLANGNPNGGVAPGAGGPSGGGASGGAGASGVGDGGGQAP